MTQEAHAPTLPRPVRLAGLPARVIGTVPTLAIFGNQAVSSAATFLISWFVTWRLGVDGFGNFSLYFIIATSISAVVSAAIARPFVSLESQSTPTRQRRRLGTLVTAGGYFLGGSVAISALLACAAFFEARLAVVLCVVFLSAAITIYDFFRAILFFEKAVTAAWLADLLRFTALALIFFGLARSGPLEDAMAYVNGLGLAYLIAGVAGYMFLRRRFPGPAGWTEIRALLGRLMRSGRWLSLMALCQFFNIRFIVILSFFLLGPYEAGVIRIAQTMTGLLNPITQALEYVLPRWLGGTIRNIGMARAKRRFRETGAALILGITLLLSLVALQSEWLFRLYRIEETATATWVLWAFIAAYVLNTVYALMLFERRATGDTLMPFVAVAVSAAATLAFAWPLTAALGIHGAAIVVTASHLLPVLVLSLSRLRRTQ